MNEVDRVQEAIASLLLDEHALVEWTASPVTYARRLPTERTRRAIAGLDPFGVGSAARGMAKKRSNRHTEAWSEEAAT